MLNPYSPRSSWTDLRRSCFRTPWKIKPDSPNIFQLEDSTIFSEDSSSESELLIKLRETCPFCDTRFESVRQMEQHVKNVHERRFVCDICNKSCSTRSGLFKHKVTHVDRCVICNICQCKYKNPQNLKRHVIRAHSKLKPRYFCDYCGRSYRQRFDLMVHLKNVHKSESQMCRYCGREVKDVKSHEWRHEKRNKDTIYAFPCTLCVRKFHTKSRLENHQLVHKQIFKCEDCNKEYRSPRELNGHRRKHGQPLNECTICSKLFSNISNFYQHVLTHAGIRPYKCDICEEYFTQRSSLIRHRRNHPGPLPKLITKQPPIAELARSYLNIVKREKDNDKTNELM